MIEGLSLGIKFGSTKENFTKIVLKIMLLGNMILLATFLGLYFFN